jgi:hypothetical protein
MKCLNFCVVAFCCLISLNAFAQTPQQIESDLLKLFKKIDYWREKQYDTTVDVNKRINSLEIANDGFAKKLKFYAEKFPSVIAYPFNALKEDYLDIMTSSDNMFRIYSWDTETGGTMHFFESVMQYKSGSGYKAIIDTPKSEGEAGPLYTQMYTLKTNGKTYYLTIWLFIGSTIDMAEGLHVYTIEKGKLIDANLIKTHSGVHSELSYEAHGNSYDRPKIHFDGAANIIYLPLVTEGHNFTSKFILYKFTGQYFERVKN